MDTDAVIETIAAIPIGTILSWLAVLGTVIAATATAAIKIYKAIVKVQEGKKENEELKNLVKKHDKELEKINQTLEEIKKASEDQRDVNLKQVRHTIVHTSEEALDAGSISIYKLKSLEEMYEEYTGIFHGNGYVKTLMVKVRELPVTGGVVEDY